MVNILIAIRDRIVGLDLVMLCRRSGYATVHITNSSEIISAYNRHKPELAIWNIDDPGTTMLERYIQEIAGSCSIPFILLTTLPEDQCRKIQLNNRSVLCRLPYSDEEIINYIKALLPSANGRGGKLPSDKKHEIQNNNFTL